MLEHVGLAGNKRARDAAEARCLQDRAIQGRHASEWGPFGLCAAGPRVAPLKKARSSKDSLEVPLPRKFKLPKPDTEADLADALGGSPTAIALAHDMHARRIPQSIKNLTQDAKMKEKANKLGLEYISPKPALPANMTKLCTRINLPPGDFFTRRFNTNKDWRDVSFFAGSAGAGKSMEIGSQLLVWKEQRPEMPIYGICATDMEDDKAYRGMGIHQLGSSKDWSAFTGPGGFDIESLGSDGCLIIADDWDAEDNKDKGAILKMLNKVCAVGRKLKLNLWWTCHETSDYRDTSKLISNTHFLYVYPAYTGLNKLMLLLKDKAGLSANACKEIASMTTVPWVCMHKSAPRMVYSTNMVALIKDDEIMTGNETS